MLRLSKLADYATVVLIRLARPPGLHTSPGIAQGTGIPEPTVAKVLKRMAASGLVTSIRGARGGYRLTRPLAAIGIADVIAAIDGPILLTACADGGSCETERCCPARGRWDVVNDAVRRALSAVTLADLEEASLPPSLRIETSAPALTLA